MNSQFVIYILFAVGWPLLFAAIYSQLERWLPNLLVPDHRDEPAPVVSVASPARAVEKKSS